MTTERIAELVDALEDDHATKAACERLLSSAERLRFRALYRMVHPLATFLHWLDEAAK